MKEHFQDSGVRKWAGDDLIELQSESLEALQGLVEPYAPCIIRGCDVTTVPGADGGEPAYEVSGGLAALRGVDAAGSGCVKIVRVEEFTSVVMPVYLSLTNKQTSRAYGDGSSKVIANDYIAEHSAIASEGALELTSDGGERLVDKLGVTQKLDRDGGEAKDTMVGFTAATTRTELISGSKLGVLFGLVKKWFSDLRALAFKDKVAKGDLDAALTTELDNKVTQVDGKGLSTNDFTDALKDKVNNHSHAWSTITGKPSTFTPSYHSHDSLTGFSDTRNVAETPNSYNGGFYVKGIKTYSACGLTRLQAGNSDYVQVFGYRGWDDSSGGYAHEFALTDRGLIWYRMGSTTTWSDWVNLVRNIDLKWGSITGKPTTFAPSTHNHAWGEITGKPSTFAPSTHNHAWGEITGKPSTFAPSAHNHTPSSIGAPQLVATGSILAGSNDDPNFSRSGTGTYSRYGTDGLVVVKTIGEGTARVYRVGFYTYVKTLNTSGVAADMTFEYMILK